MSIDAIVIDNDLDKECSALGGLFQQIVNEMKVAVPNFEEFVSKASKLHSTLKATIVVLGSFLDTFQKIADAATNTKGATRDIGTCLTRIVIRHRALESRMKTLSGAVMDCLVLPIQGKLEEWKKIVVALDKEHAKEFKKHRAHIKKKSDQVLRLRKKTRKDRISDPSVQRLLDQCTRDLNAQFRSLLSREKTMMRRALLEERGRYCTFVACLKPVIDEEFGMLNELQQVEEVMHKLSKATINPSVLPAASEQVIEDIQASEETLCFATPPSTPSPSLGSRKNSMCSISSMVSASSRASSVTSIATATDNSPSHGQQLEIPSSQRLSMASHDSGFPSDLARPGSSNSHNKEAASLWESVTGRPHTISYDRSHSRPGLSASTFAPPNKNELSPKEKDQDSYSTIKRSFRSPFRRPSFSGSTTSEAAPLVARRPPLPQRCASVDRSTAFRKGEDVEVIGFSSSKSSPTHYAVPRTLKLQMVPDFHAGKNDMVIPQPVIYMNTEDLDRLKKEKDDSTEEDLKTPTVEEISFPGQKATAEDGSSSSSGSIGSSSGYGSQNTIKIDEANGNNNHSTETGFATPRTSTLQRSSSSSSSKPPPPIRRTPSITSQNASQTGLASIGGVSQPGQPTSLSRSSSFRASPVKPALPPEVDEDPTPHGSVENLDQLTDMRRSPMRRSQSAQQRSINANREPVDNANFLHDLSSILSSQRSTTTPRSQSTEGWYRKTGTHHVIPINQESKVKPRSDKPSPEGEIYGFGMKFKENTRQYYTKDSREAVQNQLFLDALSAKLTGASTGIPSASVMVAAAERSVRFAGESAARPPYGRSVSEPDSKLRLNEEIQRGTFNLKKTNVVNDRSAPRF